MQDHPTVVEMLDLIAGFLRHEAMPQLTGASAFHARVAANAVDLVRRELQLRPAAEEKEHAALRKLLNADGSLPELHSELCRRIAAGELTLSNPQLGNYLWLTTLAKLAVDQPTYASYRQELERRPA